MNVVSNRTFGIALLLSLIATGTSSILLVPMVETVWRFLIALIIGMTVFMVTGIVSQRFKQKQTMSGAKFAVFERGRLRILESARLNHGKNGAAYILKNRSPYASGFRFCSRCQLYILTSLELCPDCRNTHLRTR